MGLGRNHYRGVPEGGYLNVKETSKNLHVYVNSETGNDSYNGLTIRTPKKTLTAAFNVLPYRIRHKCSIHLRGTFTTEDNGNYINFCKDISYGGTVIIDGGIDEKDVISGPHVAAVGSTSSNIVSSLPMVTDEFAGCTIEFLDGACVGQRRMIQKNDSTNISPCRLLTASASECSFQIYEPSTAIDLSLVISCLGAGSLYFQNIHFSSDGSSNIISIYRSTCHINLSGCVTSSTSGNSVIICNAGALSATGTQFNPDDFSFISFNTYHSGLGVLSGGTILFTSGSSVLGFGSCYLGSLSLFESYLGSWLLSNGTRLKGSLDINNVGPASPGSALIYNTSSYNPIRLDSSDDVGMKLTDSFATLAGTGQIIFENNLSHGIEVINATLKLERVVSGGGNGGAGIYAHSNSVVLMADGYTSTLSGTVGDVSTDGVTQASTWTAIDGGTPVVSMTEMTIIKEF